jgi:hypothetical protein
MRVRSKTGFSLESSHPGQKRSVSDRALGGHAANPERFAAFFPRSRYNQGRMGGRLSRIFAPVVSRSLRRMEAVRGAQHGARSLGLSPLPSNPLE